MTKNCPICRHDFQTHYRKRVTCSSTCRSMRISQQFKGRQPSTATTDANAKLHRARLHAAIGQRFGELTERELTIFRFGMERGYDRGYRRVQKAAA